jgi:hypothetical protein
MATINLGNLTFTHKGDYAGGTAYVKNDVVYYATNGNSYIAKTSTTGNAPTSTAHWDLFVAGSGGIWNAGLSLGSAGQIVKVNSSGNALEFGTDAGGSIRKISMFNDATYNVSISSASVSFPITFDFVKDQADSDLFVQGWTPVSEQASHIAGMRMRLQKTSDSSYAGETDNEAYGGQLYAGMPSSATSDDQKGVIHWSRRIDTSSETFFNSATTYRIHLGWSSRGGSSERPGEIWNPQHRSGRHRQSSTQIWVWEVDPTKTAFIT